MSENQTLQFGGQLDPRQETVNAPILARLAKSDVNNAVQDFGALPIDIRESLSRQMAEQKQEVVDAAASEIVKLLSNKDKFLVSNQLRIAELQRQIDDINSLQASVQRATQYGMATQNFLPILKLLGGSMPHGVEKSETEVPKSWNAPAAAAPEPAVTPAI